MAEPTHVTWADVMQAFHVGDACQHAALPPLDTLVNPPEEPEIPLGRDASLRVPRSRPRFGTDDDGNPIEAPLGGIPFDAEAGTLLSPDAWPKDGESQAEPKAKAEPRPEPTGASRAERPAQRT